MNCADCQELLVDYLLGQADKFDRQRVDEHLARCSNCRRACKDLSDTLGKLPSILTPQEPPPHAEETLIERIHELRSGTGAVATDQGVPRRWRVALNVAATFLMALISYHAIRLTVLRDVAPTPPRKQRLVDSRAKQETESIPEHVAAPDHPTDVRLVSLRSPQSRTDARGFMVQDFVSNQVHFYGFGLEKLAPGKVHRIWFVSLQDKWIPSGVLNVNEDGIGRAVVDVPSIGNIARVVVTVGPTEVDTEPSDQVELVAEFK